MSRCSYNSNFKEFIAIDDNLIFGVIDGSAHGITLTTAKEAWKEEMPSAEEMEFRLKTLAEHDFNMDFIITHCCPQQVVAMFSGGCYKADELTEYFDVVTEKTKFKKWFFGHYHDNRQIMCEYVMLYEQIIRIA